MLLTMGVSLYTVRVVLDILGTVDYGIYNVVAGVVAMFSVLSATMGTASQRFFSFEIGRNNQEQLKKTFAMTMNIYLILGLIILLLAETAGLWLLNHKMTIPPERMDAARWVYQFSILTFVMTMFTIPYRAAIVAHENMSIFAYISIIEVVLKLVIVYVLIFVPIDKLQLYGILVFAVTTLVTMTYRFYCKKKFWECKYQWYWDNNLFKEITSYSGWNLFGSLAGVLNNHGINVLLNIFFSPTVNAARGISFRVNTAINQFSQNFMMATNPQIIKYYASGEQTKMKTLVFQSSKFSFFLLFILSLPIYLEVEFIMGIWLKEVPEYAVIFTKLILIQAVIDAFSYPLMTAAQATGKVKQYQIIVGGTMLLILPLSYLVLKLGAAPQSVLFVGIGDSVICLFLRLIVLSNLLQLEISRFIAKVIIPSITVVVLAVILPVVEIYSFNNGWIRFFIICITSVSVTALLIFLIGINSQERTLLLKQSQKIMQKFSNK